MKIKKRTENVNNNRQRLIFRGKINKSNTSLIIWLIFALLIVLLYKAAVCGTVTDALAAAAAFTQFNVYAVVPAVTLIFVEPSASLYPCAS